MDDYDIFYYDYYNSRVCGVSKYHQENCSIGALAEAHPGMIYFYAKLELA